MINGLTFDKRAVLSRNDARFIEKFYSDGILHGCAMTYSGKDLSISTGYIIAKGRLVEIISETSTTNTTSANGYGRLKLVLDLSIAASKATFTQHRLEWAYAATNTFDALTQNDINDGTNTLYEIELCRVKFTSSNITSVVSQMGTLDSLHTMINLATSANYSVRLSNNGIAIYDKSAIPNMLALFSIFPSKPKLLINNASGVTQVEISYDAAAGGQIKLYNANGTLKETIG